MWNIANGQVSAQEGIKAPTYQDIFMDMPNGSLAFNPTRYDPALAMTLNAGQSGNLQRGLAAFLTPTGNPLGMTDGQLTFGDEDMKNLAHQLGIDVGDRTGSDLQSFLDPQLGNYLTIGGLSQGWNPNVDGRGANLTLYRRENGQLVPLQTQGYHAPERSQGWLGDHPGILAPLGIAAGGIAALASGYGAGAGAASSAGASGAGTGAAGSSAAGAGGAASASIPQSIANFLGVGDWYAGLPAWGQGMVSGAGQGALRGALTGGNPITGAISGGLSGGLSSLGGGFLSDLGLPSGLSSIGGRLIGSVGSSVLGQALGGSGAGGATTPRGGGGGTILGGSAVPGGGAIGGALGLRSQTTAETAAQQALFNRVARAGDAANDNPLISKLREASF